MSDTTPEVLDDQKESVERITDSLEYMKSIALALIHINDMYSDLIKKLNDNGLTKDQAALMQPAVDEITREYKKLKKDIKP